MRPAPSLSLLFLALVSSLAQAQESAPAPVPYEDKVIDPSRLPPLPPDEDEIALGDSQGMPRSINVDASWGRSQNGDRRYEEEGLGVRGFVSTPRWGDFSVEGTLSRDNEEGRLRSSVSLWQRNFRLDNGWTLDNGAGVGNTPAPDLMRQQYRFFLPTASFMGVQSQATHEDRLQLQVAAGQPGVFSGTRLAGFESRKGHVLSASANYRLNDQWSVAAAAIDTRVDRLPEDRSTLDFINTDTTAAFAATAWKGVDDQVQFNVLSSRADGKAGSGVWVDAASARGRYTHHYGAFYLQPDLAWGLAPINNDLSGAYYRLAYQYGRWDWNTGLDQVRSLSGQGLDGSFATGYARYQLSRTLGMGGSGSLRHSHAGQAVAASMFVDKHTPRGQSRLQLDLADDGDGTRDQQVSADHAFVLQGANRLAVNLSLAQTQFADSASARQTALSFYGGRDLTDTLSLDGNVRITQGVGGDAVRGADINVGLAWRPSHHWNISANYYRSEGTQRTPFVLDPLIPNPGRLDLPRNQAFYVSVRYDWNAGRPTFIIGGAPGSANGALSGTLFLDENINGRREANEQPAANVTVMLDGRFSVRTDTQGRYEFPMVSVGIHRLSIVPDNLPLPWSFEQSEQSVQISTRANTVLDIGAVRPR